MEPSKDGQGSKYSRSYRKLVLYAHYFYTQETEMFSPKKVNMERLHLKKNLNASEPSQSKGLNSRLCELRIDYLIEDG